MNAIDVPLVLPWLAFAVAWGMLGMLVCAVYALGRRRLATLAADQRAGLLLALALLPAVAAAGAAVLAFAPAVGGLIVDPHCHADVGCVSHVPTLRTQASLAALLVVAVAVLTAAIGRSASKSLRRSLALVRTLELVTPTSSRPRPVQRGRPGPPTIEVADSGELFAYCTGFLNPRIVVSHTLLETLPPLEREAVLAHEQAHAVRHDNLRRLLAGIALWVVPRPVRRAFMRDLALAAELACDRIAAAHVGSVDLVMRALEASHRRPSFPTGPRARSRFTSAVSSELHGGTSEERVAALEGPPGRRLRPASLAVLVASLYVTATLGMTLVAHHGAELLLDGLR